MKYVLDASAFFSGIDFSLDNELLTSPKILDELKHGKLNKKVQYLLDCGLKVILPNIDSILIIKNTAIKTGDINRISEADLEVLSLTLELDATLLTDDYSLQNLASILKIKYRPVVQDGITKEIKWTYRCRGCGRYFKEKYNDCPICVSEIKTTFQPRKNL